LFENWVCEGDVYYLFIFGGGEGPTYIVVLQERRDEFVDFKVGKLLS
jgi:hypothetical protein